MIEYYKNLSLENLFYINDDGLVCQEEFKDILDYEGFYQVSDLGRVKSLNYKHTGKEGILKQCFNGNKYLTVNLYKSSSPKTRVVHQLVAVVFLKHIVCGNINVINHKNFIRTNNSLENLEIVTNRENTNQKHMVSSSKYTGVQWDVYHKKWKSALHLNGKKIHIGYFDDEEEASQYYENALIAIQNGTEIQLKRRSVSSKYKGICWNKKANKWKARITINKVVKNLGDYETEIEAHEVRENYIKQITQ